MMTNLMTILERKAFISSNPRIVLSSCPPPCGHFSIQESATGGLSYKVKKCPKICLTFFGFFPLNHIFFRTIITLKRSVIQMSEKTTDNKLPYTCTSAYDRNACKGCVCSTCYEQEFCDRCSSCENQSKRKERCNAYEGAYNY